MQSFWKWRIRTLRRDSTAAAVVLSASGAGVESGKGWAYFGPRGLPRGAGIWTVGPDPWGESSGIVGME